MEFRDLQPLWICSSGLITSRHGIQRRGGGGGAAEPHSPGAPCRAVPSTPHSTRRGAAGRLATGGSAPALRAINVHAPVPGGRSTARTEGIWIHSAPRFSCHNLQPTPSGVGSASAPPLPPPQGGEAVPDCSPVWALGNQVRKVSKSPIQRGGI